MHLRSKPTVVPVKQPEHGVAYCAECGKAVRDYFMLGEMVLVDSGKDRPYYAQLVNITTINDFPEATVAINPTETAKISLFAVRKVMVP